MGKAIALAYLRREASDPGTRVSLASGAEAVVTALPFHQSPRLAPGRGGVENNSLTTPTPL
ncbi:MAG: hypothetical protein ACRD1N_08775 [Terriglobia bacterium]